MYTIRYAIRAIARYRGRYLLFGLVLAVLVGVCFVNLTLGEAAGEVCEAIKREFGGYMHIYATTPGSTNLTREEYLAFGESELVEEVEFRSVVWNNAYSVLRSEDRSDAVADSDFWMIGFNPAYPNPLNQKPAVLTAGRLPEAENECLMSEDFFAYLCADGVISTLGDRFYRADSAQTYDAAAGKYVRSYTMVPITVVGLLDGTQLDPPYRDLHAENDHYLIFPYEQVCALHDNAAAKRTIYNTPFYGEERELATGYAVRYRLRSYTDSEAFREFVDEKLYAIYAESWNVTGGYAEATLSRYSLKRDLTVEPVMPEFAQLLPPLEQMQTFSTLTTATLAVLATAVVALMCIINMRERKYELGVLRCVGMSRPKITVSLGTELAAFLLVTALAGIALGAMMFAVSGDALLDLTVVETAIDTAAIGRLTAGGLVGAALLLSIFATTLSAGFVMRARPLAILRNRT